MTPNLITLTNPRSPAAEAYRTLRTNLLFSSVNHPTHTLVVTAPAADAGKSAAVANLAVTMAQGGRITGGDAYATMSRTVRARHAAYASGVLRQPVTASG